MSTPLAPSPQLCRTRDPRWRFESSSRDSRWWTPPAPPSSSLLSRMTTHALDQAAKEIQRKGMRWCAGTQSRGALGARGPSPHVHFGLANQWYEARWQYREPTRPCCMAVRHVPSQSSHNVASAIRQQAQRIESKNSWPFFLVSVHFLLHSLFFPLLHFLCLF